MLINDSREPIGGGWHAWYYQNLGGPWRASPTAASMALVRTPLILDEFVTRESVGWRMKIPVALMAGDYQVRKLSTIIPEVPVEEVVPFLRRSENQGDVALAKKIRAWIQRHLARKNKPQ